MPDGLRQDDLQGLALRTAQRAPVLPRADLVECRSHRPYRERQATIHWARMILAPHGHGDEPLDELTGGTSAESADSIDD
jgi:hypothetical protein